MTLELSLKNVGNKKLLTKLTGFEPVQGDPNGFLVHRLNQLATTTYTLNSSQLSSYICDFEGIAIICVNLFANYIANYMHTLYVSFSINFPMV